jgi:uncharacterized protein (TIGR03067 family)
MLAKRLARHGLAVSGGLLTAVLAQNAASASAPTAVVSATIQAASVFAAGQAAATGAISVKVAALTEGVLKTMLFTKLKVVMVVLVGAALSGGAGLIYQTQAAEQPKVQKTEKSDKEKQPAAKKDQKPKPDKEQLEGTWKIVTTVENGEELKDDAAEVGEWTFKDTTVRIKSQPKDMKTGTVTHFLRLRLDETSNPKCIDLLEWEQDFDDADERKEGVYAIDGHTLKVCYSLEKGNRPTLLESKQGSGHILIILKRANPKDEQKRDDTQEK